MAKVLLVQQYFEASNRQAEGLVQLFQEKLAVQETSNYKTIGRGYNNDDMLTLVETTFDAAESVTHTETKITTHDTSLPTNLKINNEAAKRKGRKRDWEHMVAGVRPGHRHDAWPGDPRLTPRCRDACLRACPP